MLSRSLCHSLLIEIGYICLFYFTLFCGRIPFSAILDSIVIWVAGKELALSCSWLFEIQYLSLLYLFQSLVILQDWDCYVYGVFIKWNLFNIGLVTFHVASLWSMMHEFHTCNIAYFYTSNQGELSIVWVVMTGDINYGVLLTILHVIWEIIGKEGIHSAL